MSIHSRLHASFLSGIRRTRVTQSSCFDVPPAAYVRHSVLCTNVGRTNADVRDKRQRRTKTVKLHRPCAADRHDRLSQIAELRPDSATRQAVQRTATNELDMTGSAQPSSELSSSFRSFMRAVPNPVCVITANAPEIQDTAQSVKQPIDTDSTIEAHPSPSGMTVSSLTSVSLSPHIMLSFNVRRPSRTLNAIEAGTLFRIHVLRDNNAGAILAHAFARPQSFESQCRTITDVAKCKVIDARGGPLLQGLGVIGSLFCEMSQTIEVQDHVIVVARVESIELDQKTGSGDATLTYAHGQYHSLGEIIVPNT